MAEELGTRDVLEQMDSRLGNVEQDVRGLRTDVTGLRADLNARFESQTRWLVGLMLGSWLTIMTIVTSIWLKT